MVSASDVKGLFMQSLLSRRVVSEKLALLLYNKCIEAVKAVNADINMPRANQTQLDGVFNELNGKLETLKMDIKLVSDEYSETRFYILVNLQGDPISQFATGYSPNEVIFFKAIVEQIMLAKNEAYCIGSTAALRETPVGVSKAQAQSTLASFVTDGWLLKIDNRYCLAPRTLAELETYLKNNFEDIRYNECVICHSIITRGYGCHHRNCQTRIHQSCYSRFKASRPTLACPSCRGNWGEVDAMRHIGAEEFVRGQDDTHMSRPSATESSDSEPEATQATSVED